MIIMAGPLRGDEPVYRHQIMAYLLNVFRLRMCTMSRRGQICFPVEVWLSSEYLAMGPETSVIVRR